MKKSPNTNKNLIYKFQKPIIFALFFSMIFLFVYSLIFFTPFYDFYILDSAFSKSNAITYGVWSDDLPTLAYALKNEKVFGLDMHYFVSFAKESNGYGGEMQSFNHFLFNFGVIGIVVTAISFLFYSQKRKVFYPTNYIFLGISCLFGLGTSIYGISNIASWSSYIKNNVRFDVINAYENYLNDIDPSSMVEYYSYNGVKWVFILGYIVFIAIILVSICGLIYGVLRFIYQKKNPPMDLSEVNIDE